MNLSDRRAVPFAHAIARFLIMFPFTARVAPVVLSAIRYADPGSSPAGGMG